MNLARRLFATSLIALAAGTAAAPERYPSRPGTLVVPQAAGGAHDAIARVIAQKLGEVMSQTFVVENRVGAGGNVGTAAVAKARNDGYTLMLTANSAQVRAPASTRSRTSSPSPRWPRPATCWSPTTASRHVTSASWSPRPRPRPASS